MEEIGDDELGLSLQEAEIIPIIMVGSTNSNTEASRESVIGKTQLKIIKMSQYIHTNQLQYNLARLKTDTDCQGLVYLLFTLYRAEKHTLPFSLLQISNEVFYACIFTFLSPYTTPDDFKQLGQFEYEQFIERFKPKKTVEPNPHDNNQWSCVMQ